MDVRVVRDVVAPVDVRRRVDRVEPDPRRRRATRGSRGGRRCRGGLRCRRRSSRRTSAGRSGRGRPRATTARPRGGMFPSPLSAAPRSWQHGGPRRAAPRMSLAADEGAPLGRDHVRRRLEGLRRRNARGRRPRPRDRGRRAHGHGRPVGCGKTTALRMLAGLEEISEGTISIGDEVVNDLTPKERDIAMVFQSYALYPHMTVEDNLAFGLRFRKMSKPEIEERVRKAAAILQIEEYLDRKPKALSGGQRQRVAMGRAIVREPQAFLMDEPLLEPRREAPGADARRDPRPAAAARRYDRVRHARPDGGDDARRSRRRDAARAGCSRSRPHRRSTSARSTSSSRDSSARLRSTWSRRSSSARTVRSSVSFGGHTLAVADELVRGHAELGEVRRAARSCSVSGPEDIEDASLDSGAPPDRRLAITCDYTEPLGAEVLVYFTVAATGVVSGVAREPIRRSRRRRGDEAEGARLVARVDPEHGSPKEAGSSSLSTRVVCTSSTRRPGPRI